MAEHQNQENIQQGLPKNDPQFMAQSDLIKIKKESYGDDFKAHLLEQYKIYVEMMDRVTERRGKTNTFYLSLLSGLLALLSLLVDQNLFSGDKDVLLLLLAILGLSLCCIWYFNINSYKQLNYLKFKVIHEIEALLPFPCYSREWQIEKNKNSQYRRLSRVEKYIPLIITIPYFGLLIYSAHGLFK